MNKKNIDQEISIVNNFETKKNQLINNEGYNYIIQKNDNEFVVITNKKVNMENSKFRFENIDNMIFKIDDVNIKIVSSRIKPSTGIPGINSIFKIDKFSSNDFDENKKLKYKLIIPYDEDIKIRYYDYFCYEFIINVNNAIFSGITFRIKDYHFQIYHLNKFFIVESLDEIDFESFNQYCRFALVAFGFITGFVPMDRGYYFGYKGDKCVQWLYDSTFDETYKTQYNLISTNAYAYYENVDLKFDFDSNGFQNDERIEALNKKLKSLERKTFETLIYTMIENLKFADVIFSIIAINNLKSFSVFLKAGLYSIVLEMIATIVYNQENKVEESIAKKENKSAKKENKSAKKENKSAKKELQGKLHDLSKDFYKKQGWDYADSIVDKRLNGIYTPINMDKLLLAYKLLGISLNQKEEKNIKLRNKFLHGILPFKNKDDKGLVEELLRINLELNYLVNALIFKYIGYDGILKNLAKIYLNYTNLDEIQDEKCYKDLNG